MNRESLFNVSIESVKPYTNNPRDNKKAIKKVKNSIRDFDYTSPIIVDENNIILAGHTRLEALKALGYKTIPEVVMMTGFDEEKKTAYRIADNSTASVADWDMDLLKKELENISYNMEDYGLDIVFKEEPEETEGDDEVPEQVVAKTVRGDIYELGQHRLMCGDSTMIDDVEKLMDGQKADMVFTDPPYKIETEGGCKGIIGKGLKKQGKNIEFISNFEPEAFLQTLPTVFEKNKINAYVFCNKELLPDYLVWARNIKYSFNVLVWKKPQAIPIGDSHRPDIEYLLLFRKNAIWNNGLNDVNYSRCIEEKRESGLHPTMKPVSLIINEMYISSNEGSNVFDFFIGSGSTLIACEKTNRKCFGMELDEHYCDVTVQRYTDFCKKNNKEYTVKRNNKDITNEYS